MLQSTPEPKNRHPCEQRFHKFEALARLDAYIGNANSHPTNHKCDPDGAMIATHTHVSGAAGHLQKGGLSPAYYEPLEPLIFSDEVFTTSWFDIPAHTVAAPTDHRAL